MAKYCSCCGSRKAKTSEEGSNCEACDLWIWERTYKPMFEKVRAAFKNQENVEKWDEMDDGLKTAFVNMMVEEGIITFEISRSAYN